MSDTKDDIMKLLANEEKTQDKSDENEVVLGNDSPEDLQVEVLKAKIDQLKEKNEGLKQDREQRKIFSYVIFAFMCLYMASAMLIVFLCGNFDLSLSDGVLITLLTTTLANVIGVFNFVAKYLFNPKG